MSKQQPYIWINACVVGVFFWCRQNGGAAHIVGNNFPLRGSKTTVWEGGTRAVSFVYSKTLLKEKGYVHEG